MSADSGKLIGCEVCGLVQRLAPLSKGYEGLCVRCNAVLASRTPTETLNRTLALVITGLILYIPSNLFPVIRTTTFGAVQDSTIWSGMVQLVDLGDWPIALVVLFASIFVPLTKLLGLLYIVLAHKVSGGRVQRTRMYLLIAKIGKWSMLDVFVVSITVALVQFGELSTAEPGPGVIAFAAVVIVTLTASITFDPKAIWERAE
ncbi:MAG: paraquat-inducible protein A [Alphaproteobacteria bacterium]|nr:paraquat-inducible protein A [Alphaproteobacteria bacterium]